MDRFVKL